MSIPTYNEIMNFVQSEISKFGDMEDTDVIAIADAIKIYLIKIVESNLQNLCLLIALVNAMVRLPLHS